MGRFIATFHRLEGPLCTVLGWVVFALGHAVPDLPAAMKLTLLSAARVLPSALDGSRSLASE